MKSGEQNESSRRKKNKKKKALFGSASPGISFRQKHGFMSESIKEHAAELFFSAERSGIYKVVLTFMVVFAFDVNRYIACERDGERVELLA